MTKVYAVVKQLEQDEISVAAACDTLQIARSGYYRFKEGKSLFSLLLKLFVHVEFLKLGILAHPLEKVYFRGNYSTFSTK